MNRETICGTCFRMIDVLLRKVRNPWRLSPSMCGFEHSRRLFAEHMTPYAEIREGTIAPEPREGVAIIAVGSEQKDAVTRQRQQWTIVRQVVRGEPLERIINGAMRIVFGNASRANRNICFRGEEAEAGLQAGDRPEPTHMAREKGFIKIFSSLPRL